MSILKAPPKEDWFAFVEQEDGETFVYNIVEEVLQKTTNTILQKKTEEQLLPYTVEFARDTVMDVIDWHFFKRDPGHIQQESWTPDEEPEPAAIDAWARGVIPIRTPVIPPAAEHISDKTLNNLESEDNLNASESAKQPEPTSQPPTHQRKSSSVFGAPPPRRATVTDSPIRQPTPQSESKQAAESTSPKRQPISSHRMPPSEKAIQEENRKLLARMQGKDRDGEAPGFTYDLEGRIVVMKKAAPNKLVTEGVKARVIDPEPSSPTRDNNSSTRLSRPNNSSPPKRPTSNFLAKKVLPHLRQNVPASTQQQKSGANGSSTSKMDSSSNQPQEFTEDPSLELPRLIDHINLAPGATVKEGNAIKRSSASSQRPQNNQVSSKLHALLAANANNANDKYQAVGDDVLQKVLSQVQVTVGTAPLGTEKYPKLPEIERK